jgi:hypothetical protein
MKSLIGRRTIHNFSTHGDWLIRDEHMEKSLGYRNLARLIEAQKAARECQAREFPDRFFASTRPRFLVNGRVLSCRSNFDKVRTCFTMVILKEGLVDDDVVLVKVRWTQVKTRQMLMRVWQMWAARFGCHGCGSC